ncbi:hypothetical protein [Streptomyces bluensis]|uniref:Uncharacterized protein n=1 Tax=Streptomyces bluensis TaxID=33897 RepID=A0ABW6UQ43_9ACTN
MTIRSWTIQRGALPAHAAAVGRFEEFLSAPRALALCVHPALVEALPIAFPDGVPAGTFSADLHYLDKLGLAPSSHAEWLSILHLLSLSQGAPERARADGIRRPAAMADRLVQLACARPSPHRWSLDRRH